MYNIEPFESKIYLIDTGGNYWEYSNIITAAMKLFDVFSVYNIEQNIGEHHKTVVYDMWHLPFRKEHVYPYIVRDELGNAYTGADLCKIYQDNRPLSSYAAWYRRRRHSYNPKDFRNGPVPHTGTGGFHWPYNHPHTTPEYRATVGHLLDEDVKEHNVKIRGKRRPRSLPWDRKLRSDCSNRSWKNHRKTQWKNNK